MKISEQDYKTLADAIQPLDKQEYRDQYRERRIARAESVKDIDKRYRWDLYWYAVRLGNSLPDSTHSYKDTHIDTALRKIVPAL